MQREKGEFCHQLQTGRAPVFLCLGFRGAHIGDLDQRARLRGLRVQAYRALFKLASGLLHERQGRKNTTGCIAW